MHCTIHFLPHPKGQQAELTLRIVRPEMQPLPIQASLRGTDEKQQDLLCKRAAEGTEETFLAVLFQLSMFLASCSNEVTVVILSIYAELDIWPESKDEKKRWDNIGPLA